MLEVQTIRVDPDGRRAWRGEEEVRLSRKEFDLLHLLISNAGEIVSREDLMRQVWHTDFWTSSKTIDVHLGWLRRKIGDDARRPHLISTIRGRGLRFERTAGSRGAAERDVTIDLSFDGSRRGASDLTGETGIARPTAAGSSRESAASPLRVVATGEVSARGVSAVPLA